MRGSLRGGGEAFNSRLEERAAPTGWFHHRSRRDAAASKNRANFLGKFVRGLEVSILPDITFLSLGHRQRTRMMPSTAPACAMTRLYWSRHCSALEIVR